jgi:ATP-dependent exoDNAse (exonuclease V) beta subunit
VATAVGTAIHGLLESLVLEGSATEQLRRVRRAVLERLLPELAEPERAEAENLFNELADLLEGSAVLQRLEDIGEEAVLARELPLLLPPDPERGPVGSLVGFADLIYRDPADGVLVVADYKSDRVEHEEAVAERAERYRPQLELYARALVEGLDLEEPVRRELWFLRADRVVEV